MATEKTAKSEAKASDHVIKTPSGKKVDTSRMIVGVGYTYEDGSVLSEEDRVAVNEELARRAK